jgi:hypothetical protein
MAKTLVIIIEKPKETWPQIKTIFIRTITGAGLGALSIPLHLVIEKILAFLWPTKKIQQSEMLPNEKQTDEEPKTLEEQRKAAA